MRLRPWSRLIAPVARGMQARGIARLPVCRASPPPDRLAIPRLALIGAAFALLLLFAPADAAETRYVASFGQDGDNKTCSLNNPCRTLQRGVNRTPENGALIVLDSGHLGDSVTITKSVTISADGITATLVDPGNITIDNPGAVVVLRGLHVKGTGSLIGLNGIAVNAAAAVYVERCTLEGFHNNGIAVFGADTKVFVTDTIARNNGASGLVFGGVETGRTLTIDNSRFENNGSHGVFAARGHIAITRSVASGNGGSGIFASTAGVMNITATTASQNAEHGFSVHGGPMTLESSVARGNETGLHVESGTARISRSVFTDNGTGIRVLGGTTLQTLQNNIINGNGTDLANSGNLQAPGLF